jgi:uncharacterized membrane protein
LDVLYEGLGISKIAIFDQKSFEKFSAVIFVFIFGHKNPGSGSGFTSNAGSISTLLIYSLAQKCISKVCACCTLYNGGALTSEQG